MKRVLGRDTILATITGLYTRLRTKPYYRLLLALVLVNVVSALLFVLRLLGADNFRYWFMLWNLTLAWIAPLIALQASRVIGRLGWRHWLSIGLTIIWLGFLPNSFYMVSDLIHLYQTGEIHVLFDTVLFTSFVLNGFIAGYISIMLIHLQLRRRLSWGRAAFVLTGVFALSGYAIYLGRVLRWNTWDALVSPAGLIFDISDTVLNPLQHPQAYVLTFSFALLIGSFYWLSWEAVRYIRGRR